MFNNKIIMDKRQDTPKLIYHGSKTVVYTWEHGARFG